MKTKVDYLPLVHAMEYLVNYARSLKVKRENPEGDLQTYSISDIRICYLEHQNYSQSCLNGMSADQQTTGPISEMLITLYYNNSKKIVHFPFPVNSLFLQYPETMISLLIPHLTIAVDYLIQDFYASCTEDNKYHCYDSSDAVVQLEDAAFTIKPLGKVQKKQRIAFEQLVSECYTSQEVLMVSGDIQNSRKLWIVVDSFGRRIIEYQDIFHLYLELTLLNEQKHLFVDRFSRMYTSIDALLSDFPQTRAYCQGLLSSLQRQQLKSDIYPLILSSSAVGTLFHEALAGHMLSGLYIADELSMVFKDKIGSSIVKEGFMEVLKQLEIWDVPSDSSMIAHYRYDMEGTPAQDVCLIEYGEVRNYLLDRNSAAWLRMPNNGRALAGGFCSSKAYLDGFIDRAVEPEPRVSNLKILSQSELELQDLEQFYFEKYGYYLWVESYDGAVDVTTGTFNLYVNAITKVYADGHKEYFYGGKLSANLVDFLSAISLVTKSYGRSQGYCGSSSGSVPTEEFAPIMAAYGLNWVPNPLPQKMHILDIHRDKYLSKQ